MEALTIIEKYYKKDSELYNTLVYHSADVMNKAVSIVISHPELKVNLDFIMEASMLHDIGILMTYAPDIHCFGIAPYICHGYLGAEILEREGYHEHALVCERHTGTGLSKEEIIKQKLLLPHRDMLPISLEEQIICFADCFFSKTNLGIEKSVEEIIEKFEKTGKGSVPQFKIWCDMFL